MAGEFRCRVEVLRFVSAKDNLLATSLISRIWTQASLSEEVWRELCEVYDIDLCDAGTPLRQLFRDCYPVHALPIVHTNSVRIYSVPTLTSRLVRLTCSVDVDYFSAYCFLSSRYLLVTGHRVASCNAYKIDLYTRDVTVLSPMCVKKGSHALYRHRSVVYSFGGFDGSDDLGTVEKYWVDRDQWELLGTSLHYPMQALLPVRFCSYLYLVGNFHIETFSLVTETLQDFPLTLLIDWYYCLPCVTRSGDLIVAQRDQVLTCSLLNPGSGFTARPLSRLGNGNYWSNCQPVLHENYVYSLHNSHGTIEGLLRWNLVDATIEAVVSETY